MDEQAGVLAAQMTPLVAGIEECRLLQTVPGIAEVLAGAIFAEIGSIERFESAEALVGYCGLHPEVSDLSSQATVQGGIIIVTSEASTRVMVESGQTAVIGGLIRTNKSGLELGVPLLKDIPLLGRFFGSTTSVEEQRELLIFVTPTILEVEDLARGDEAPEALER